MGEDKHPSKRRYDDDFEDDRGHRKHKKEKKEKKEKKDKKSHKHRSHDGSEPDSEDEDELVQKAKKLIQKIDENDYFNKSTEFRVWLREEKGKYFDDLESSIKAREYFAKFIKAWNSYKLPVKYYDGIRSSQISGADRTRHRWNFKNVNVDEVNKIKDTVDTMNMKGGDSAAVKRVLGPAKPPARPAQDNRQSDDDEDMDSEDRYQIQRAIDRQARNHERKKREELLDEIAPKETGREAILAKRRNQREFLHRERDYDIEIDDKDLMGIDDFKAKLAAQNRAQELRKNQREQEKAAVMAPKVEEYKKKEDATMAMFRKLAEEQKKRGGMGARSK